MLSDVDFNLSLWHRDGGHSDMITVISHCSHSRLVSQSLEARPTVPYCSILFLHMHYKSHKFVLSSRSRRKDGKLHFWELVEATPLAGAQQGHSAAVLCLAFFEETLVSWALRGRFWSGQGPVG